MAGFCLTETPIKIYKQDYELIERSPEPFPKLTLFPDGWDLLTRIPAGTSLQKEEIKRESDTLELLKFPGATDSWI